ncbi:exo-alpha-sialidase [Rhizobium sp. XQZ8]|uniref:sialidase family protein n=1 Tax=Rhizobium populisoli TaxID=2859785 RepID=UPI001CA55E7B|nr:exo-alpha-sialidase [Rhizobium populisoli]MBW6422122.1 exo-alpha-sialidase [Rhizobium populisoli]
MTFTALDPSEVPALMTGEIGPNGSGRSDAYLPSPCVQNHAANLAFLADGTLTCVWFGGTMEGMGDISVYMSRLAPGATTWSKAEKLSDDATKSEQNPLVFTAPDGKVWLLYTSQTSGNQDGAVVKKRVSADGGRTFGAPEILCDIPGTFIRQAIVVNADGNWLLPVFRCLTEAGRRWTGDIDRAGVLISRDAGKSWQMVEVPDSIGAVHMNIVPLQGRDMVAFYRNRFATRILRSRSSDNGLTWSAPEPTELPNNNSSIQASRLKDGAIAVVYNHSDAGMSDARRLSLYDEIEGDDGEEAVSEPEAALRTNGAVWGVPRAPLSLAISRDGGETFPVRFDLDTGDGYCLSNNSTDMLNREFSYPSVIQGPGGVLHIAYTYFRRAIKYVRLEPSFFEI